MISTEWHWPSDLKKRFLQRLSVSVAVLAGSILSFSTCCADGAVSGKRAEDELQLVSPPAFAVRFSDGKSRVFGDYKTADTDIWSYSDENLTASVERIEGNQWELSLSTKASEIKEVTFPWFTKKLRLGSNPSDDKVYYPYLFGILMEPEARGEWDWWGVDYPGACFAPVMIIADGTEAIMVAATNWPPKRVRPVYSLRRMHMVYPEKLGSGDKFTCRAMITRVKGDVSNGLYPWHLALDNYKSWLKGEMKREGLYPVSYPSWMEQVEGFMNIQLENMMEFDVADIYEKWNRWGEVFPWIQFWGQMSEGYPNPDYSCCLEKQEVHQRYMPELITFARNIIDLKGLGGHVGYYSRPLRETVLVGSGSSDAETSLEFLLEWIRVNKEQYYANVFYLDTVGGRYMGDPLRVAKLFRSTFPQETFIEFPVDMYPTAFLVSGSLGGRQWSDKKWGREPSDLGKGFKIAAYPRFGRYLLDDRIIFMGQSNGDHVFWGPGANYWGERSAFLLGAKFDIMSCRDSRSRPDTLNAAVSMAVSERRRVNWWDRRPAYRDMSEICNVPDSISVRRFVDSEEKNLIVVDNWRQMSGAAIRFRGQTVDIPRKRLCIIEVD